MSAYIVNSPAEHTDTIIFLHGRDSAPEEFAEDFFESEDSDGRSLADIFPNMKWVFPAAKERMAATASKVSREAGGEDVYTQQWFDMKKTEEPDSDNDSQKSGLRDSIKEIIAIVKTEAAAVAEGHLFLAGISQGCATGLHALFALEDVKIAGFFGICGWLPFHDRFMDKMVASSVQELLNDKHATARVNVDNQKKPKFDPFKVPIFLGHSEDDNIIPVDNGRKARDALMRLNVQVQWEQYAEGSSMTPDLPHWVNEPKGIDDFTSFINKCKA